MPLRKMMTTKLIKAGTPVVRSAMARCRRPRRRCPRHTAARQGSRGWIDHLEDVDQRFFSFSFSHTGAGEGPQNRPTSRRWWRDRRGKTPTVMMMEPTGPRTDSKAERVRAGPSSPEFHLPVTTMTSPVTVHTSMVSTKDLKGAPQALLDGVFGLGRGMDHGGGAPSGLIGEHRAGEAGTDDQSHAGAHKSARSGGTGKSAF